MSNKLITKDDLSRFMNNLKNKFINQNTLTDYQKKEDNNLQTTDKTVVGGINELNSNKLPLSGGTMLGTIIAGTGVENIIKNSADDMQLSIYGGKLWNSGSYLVLSGKDNTTRNGGFRLVAHDGTNSSSFVGKANGELTWNGELIGGMKAYKKRYGVGGNGGTVTTTEKVSDDSTLFIVANVRRGVGLYMVVNAGSYGNTVKEIMPVTINTVEITVNSDNTLTYKNNDSVYQWFDVIVVNNV